MRRPFFQIMLTGAMLFTLSLVSEGVTSVRQSDPATSANEVIARRFYDEVLGGANPTAAVELISPDAVFHLPEGDFVGPEGLRQAIAVLPTAFADLSVSIDDLIAAEDKVVVGWTFRATHRGRVLGIPPTGRQVAMAGISILRMTQGRIVEDWVEQDTLGLLTQLGVELRPGSSATPAT